jgi:large subunit ribosomal protein L30
VSALRVTQVRSGIGTKPKHRATLRALGLRRLGQSRVLADRPEVRGMLARVPHLVEVVDAPDAALSGPRRRVPHRPRGAGSVPAGAASGDSGLEGAEEAAP